MKNMYQVSFKKPNEYATHSNWYGGDTPEQAISAALKSAVELHNRYSTEKISESDLTVVECSYAGEYNSFLKELQKD